MVEVAQTLTPCRFAAVPLGKGDKVLVENAGLIVPLTKWDSREAAAGQGLSQQCGPVLTHRHKWPEPLTEFSQQPAVANNIEERERS